MTLPQRCTVVVVGADYAGPSTAPEVEAAGVDVHVLEAQQHIDVRIWSELRDGLRVDHGGQWVGPNQTRLLAWAERSGCPTFPCHDHGQHIELWADGTQHSFTTGGPSPSPGAEEYAAPEAHVDQLTSMIDLADPLVCPYLAVGTPRP